MSAKRWKAYADHASIQRAKKIFGQPVITLIMQERQKTLNKQLTSKYGGKTCWKMKRVLFLTVSLLLISPRSSKPHKRKVFE